MAAPVAADPGTCSLTDRIAGAVATWASSQVDIIFLAAELADSPEWVLAGSPTPAHHLAEIADIEPCTAREWIRVGKRVRGLPTIARLLREGELSYSKVRALVALATPENEAELAAIAMGCPAGALRAELARWLNRNSDPDDLAAYHRERRSLKWRTEADGMVTFTLRLPPQVAAVLIALLTALVMRSKPRPDASAGWPSLAKQHADAFVGLLEDGAGEIATEVVLHVRGDGCTADDGTPIPDTVIAELVPDAFIRALIHDADGRPIDASGRQRHPTARQKRVVKDRDRACVDCGRTDLLEYDHVPAYEESGRTLVEELELRCSPCHDRRHGR